MKPSNTRTTMVTWFFPWIYSRGTMTMTNLLWGHSRTTKMSSSSSMSKWEHQAKGWKSLLIPDRLGSGFRLQRAVIAAVIPNSTVPSLQHASLNLIQGISTYTTDLAMSEELMCARMSALRGQSARMEAMYVIFPRTKGQMNANKSASREYQPS